MPKRGLAVTMMLAVCAVSPVTVAAAAPAGPAQTVDAFHAALKAGHTDTALQMMTQDVFIAEQGFINTGRASYADGQVKNDIKFAGITTYKVINRHLIWLGDNAACVISQTRTTGSFAGHDINLVGAETMLLRKFGNRWQIAHVHWSAHPDRSADGATH